MHIVQQIHIRYNKYKHIKNSTFTPLEAFFTEKMKNSASHKELSTNTLLKILIILIVTNGSSPMSAAVTVCSRHAYY